MSVRAFYYAVPFASCMHVHEHMDTVSNICQQTAYKLMPPVGLHCKWSYYEDVQSAYYGQIIYLQVV